MHSDSRIDQARAFLDVQLSSNARFSPQMFRRSDGPFVTISREAGSGSSAVAEQLSLRLNQQSNNEKAAWAIIDQALVEQVLADEHLSPRLAKFLPEAHVSELDASIREIIGLHPNLWLLIKRTVGLMSEIAKQGNAILIGRGGNFATARIPNGIHVRLVAPLPYREAHMAEVLGIPVAEARREIKKLDACRRDFVRSVYNTDIANPTAYDLIINMARVGIEEAADLIAQRVRTAVRA